MSSCPGRLHEREFIRRPERRTAERDRRKLRPPLRSGPSLLRMARHALAPGDHEALARVERSAPDAERWSWPDLPPICRHAIGQALDRRWWPPRDGP